MKIPVWQWHDKKLLPLFAKTDMHTVSENEVCETHRSTHTSTSSRPDGIENGSRHRCLLAGSSDGWVQTRTSSGMKAGSSSASSNNKPTATARDVIVCHAIAMRHRQPQTCSQTDWRVCSGGSGSSRRRPMRTNSRYTPVLFLVLYLSAFSLAAAQEEPTAMIKDKAKDLFPTTNRTMFVEDLETSRLARTFAENVARPIKNMIPRSYSATFVTAQMQVRVHTAAGGSSHSLAYHSRHLVAIVIHHHSENSFFILVGNVGKNVHMCEKQTDIETRHNNRTGFCLLKKSTVRQSGNRLSSEDFADR